ncbi:MAG TPA: hypothetical protein VLZ74_01935 [Methylocella sp.]|nr:hypothetical protein [Methylocella sp.]
MERVLVVGGIMLVVGIALAGVVVVLTSFGQSFEMVEDHVVGWLEGH